MKISRSELRKMILESILQEKIDGSKLKNAIKKIKQNFNINLSGIPDSPEPQLSPPSANSVGSQNSSSDAPQPVPSAGPAPGPAATKKQPNRKVKQIQELINVYYDAGGIQPNKKIREDGYWGGETDRGLKDIFTFLELPNPGEKWGQISQYLRESGMGDFPATLSGLISYLISDDVVDAVVDDGSEEEAVSKEEAPASTPEFDETTPIEGSIAGSTEDGAIQDAKMRQTYVYFVSKSGTVKGIDPFEGKIEIVKKGGDKTKYDFRHLIDSGYPVHFEKDFVVKESFGKSHGTLIRERWRRY